MAHVRPTGDGFEVALDQEETTRTREMGVPLIEIVQGTPAVSPIFATEAAAEAFLDGYNAGAWATQEAYDTAIGRVAGIDGEDQWFTASQLRQELDVDVRLASPPEHAFRRQLTT